MGKSKELVFPGNFLTTEEEFSPGKNSFEDNEGRIYSDCIGESDFNLESREVLVNKKTRRIGPIEPGTIVLARVGRVKENNVLVEIFDAKKNGEEKVIAISYATIPIFNISTGFVKSSTDMFRVGDIIKAVVFSVTSYCTDLSTKEPEFGVIKAFCVKCRQPMRLIGEELKCGSCGDTETRKLSTDYMLK